MWLHQYQKRKETTSKVPVTLYSMYIFKVLLWCLIKDNAHKSWRCSYSSYQPWGGRGQEEEGRRGFSTSVTHSRSDSSHKPCRWEHPSASKNGAMSWSPHDYIQKLYSHLHRSPLKFQVIFPFLNVKFVQGFFLLRRCYSSSSSS